jgi:hypothetical protein
LKKIDAQINEAFLPFKLDFIFLNFIEVGGSFGALTQRQDDANQIEVSINSRLKYHILY